MKKMIYIGIAFTIVNVLAYTIRSAINPIFKFTLRKKLFEKFLDQTLSFFDKTSTGILISRLSEDITLLHNVYFEYLFDIILSLSQGLAALMIAFYTSKKITLISLSSVPFILITYYAGNYYIQKKWNDLNENAMNAALRAEEVITQFRIVKSNDAENKEYEIYHKRIYKVDSIYRRASITLGIKNCVMMMLEYFTFGGVVYYTSNAIVQGKGNLHVGDFMILITSLLYTAMSFTDISSFVDNMKKANVSAAKLLALLDEIPETNKKEGNWLGKLIGKIEFQNVGFKYASRDEWAVRNLSFTIYPGETVAFVGESGCGKTTTLSLIQKFYEIQEGKIFFDGVDSTLLSQEYLRSQVAIVPQTHVLFSMSISDNIKYSNVNATNEDVFEAARIGNAHDFIMELDDKFNTEVNQNSLSGGQKQRICISRAIIAQAPILLLDEATASLDTESERKVQESIETFRKGKTAIIVAHRLATVINADRIFVFKDGKIIEAGTHKDLLEKGGCYADLVKYQLQ